MKGCAFQLTHLPSLLNTVYLNLPLLLTDMLQLSGKVKASSSGHFNLCQQFLFTDHKRTLDFCIVILCNNVKDKHSEACLIISSSTFFTLHFSTPLSLKIPEYIYFGCCCDI